MQQRYLTLWDIVVLALIFFGVAIWTSTQHYFALQAENLAAPTELVFQEDSNWLGIISELGWLLAAAGYLYWRKFDWRHLDFSLNGKIALRTVGYILLAGTVATVYEYGQFYLFPELYGVATEMPAEMPVQETTESFSQNPLSQWSLSLLLFAALNGFFEEVFFVGLVFAVAPKDLNKAVLFSLVVRFAFHTYQGLAGALTITTLGIVFFLLRRKHSALLPFAWAHSFFDLFGLGLPLYLLY